ncbi:chemotaxis protein CheW [Pectinatus cerevisiiphilus]|uniref:Chemotaxis protein CheW n=1 Tax=Pectinatus cerevisiiphilus TaxID=86956 RepID=A0A4R3KCW6_9FIRM|nr:chemotaxis protein CheW [Pectinatus cerevisiiphilus]TCS80967.1 purine-binding chemotaxis protein CheW [Pectinatus cerevisiiphilus]
MEQHEVSSNEVQIVAFKLKREEYGMSILNVEEIKRLTDITRVPFTPDFIKGVMNLRGSVLPVIDLKKRIGLPDAEYTDATRIIVVKLEEITVGMIVDAVTEVLTIDTDHITNSKQIASTESDMHSESNKFINGIGNLNNRLVILLNLSEILGLNGETK